MIRLDLTVTFSLRKVSQLYHGPVELLTVLRLFYSASAILLMFSRVVSVEIMVNKKDGEKLQYLYKKHLPAEVTESQCKYEVLNY